MLFWDQIVDFLRITILAYAQFCGGNLGAGIVLTSLVVRAALFPLTLRLARAARAHQQAMQKLRPELERIRKRLQSQPARVAEETQKLLKSNGVSPFPTGSCLAGLAQAPLFIACYSAVRDVAAMGGRFLWIGNIAKPDLLLTVLVAGLTFGSAAISSSPAPSQETKQMILVMPVLVTVLVLSQASAGLALYWGVSSGASLLQGYLVRRLPVSS